MPTQMTSRRQRKWGVTPQFRGKLRQCSLLGLLFGILVMTLLGSCRTRGHTSIVRDVRTDDASVAAERIESLLHVADRFPGECTPNGDYCVYFAPKDLPIIAILAALKQAKRKVRIATYNLNVPEFATALQELLDRGVEVEFLQDFKHVYRQPRERDRLRIWHLMPNHPKLTRYALPVMRGANPQMHNKLIAIDDEVVFTGSANWTFTGVVGNYENILLIRRKELVQQLIDEMDELLAHAKVVCDAFGQPKSNCGTPDLTWEPEFHQFITGGAFFPESMADRPGFYRILGEFYVGVHEVYEELKESGVEDPEKSQQLRDRRSALFQEKEAEPGSGDGIRPLACRRYNFRGVSCDCRSVSTWLNQNGQGELSEKMNCSQYRRLGRDLYGRNICGRDGLLNGWNQGNPKNIRACFSDGERLAAVAEQVAAKEELVDGTPAGDDDDDSVPLGGHRLFFAPEDDPETALVKNLEALVEGITPDNAAEHFVYTSTNFITNRDIFRGLRAAYDAGARVQIMFDRGRWDDDNFQQRQRELSEMGVFHAAARDEELHNPDPSRAAVTVFDNKLVGSYGANHNKMAVWGGPGKVVTTTGSANWSWTGMHKNDEHVLIAEDGFLSAIYMKEILAELYAYRYGHTSSGFFETERLYFENEQRVPCLGALLGTRESCQYEGQEIAASPTSHVIISLQNVPVGYDRPLWAFVTSEGESIAYPVFTHGSFSQRWVSVIPLKRGQKAQVKFFHADQTHKPHETLDGVEWEYGGVDNGREIVAPRMSLICVHQDATWGQKQDVTWCN